MKALDRSSFPHRTRRLISRLALGLTLVIATATYSWEQEDVLVANRRAIERELNHQLSLVDALSFGTTASSQKVDALRGVQVPPKCDQLILAFTTTGNVSVNAIIHRPMIVATEGNWITIQDDQLIENNSTVSHPVDRARLLLKFGLADDAVKSAILINNFAAGCTATASVTAQNAVVVVASDVEARLTVNGKDLGTLTPRTRRALQVSIGEHTVVVRSTSEGIEEKRVVQTKSGQTIPVVFTLEDKIVIVKNQRLEAERRAAEAAAIAKAQRAEVERQKAEAAARSEFETALRSLPPGRLDRLKQSFGRLSQLAQPSDEDRAKYTRALDEQLECLVRIKSFDTRDVGRSDDIGFIHLDSVGRAEFTKKNIFEVETSNFSSDTQRLELPVGTNAFVLTFNMEFDKANFDFTECRGTVTVTNQTNELGIYLKLLRGGRIDCQLR